MSRIALLVLLSVGAFVACDAVRVRSGAVRLGSNPGAVIRVKRVALDKAFSTASKYGARYVHKIPIPDVTATVSGVTIQTTDIRITSFAEPVVKYTLTAPNKIDGAVIFSQVGISGPFNAKRHVGIGPLAKDQLDSGVIVFNTSQVVVSFQALIGEYENGVPHVAQFEIQPQLGPSNLAIKGAKEKFATEVLSIVAKGIRPGFERIVSSVTKKIINDYLNTFLLKVPNTIAFGPNLALKFQVKPEVAPDSIQVGLYGKIITEHVSPHNPTNFVEVPSDDALVVILISDAPFNDATDQLYVNKKLEWTISKDSHPLIYSLVRLSGDPQREVYLGQAAPDLAQKYGPDADVEAIFKATSAPSVKFVQGKGVYSGSLSVELNITPKNGQPVHEATIHVNNTGHLQVKIVDGVLYAKIVVDQVTVHIDNEHSKKWEDKIGGIIKLILEQYVNGDLLLKGVPLKLPFGLGFKAPLVNFNPGTLQVHTGFEIKSRGGSGSREKN